MVEVVTVACKLPNGLILRTFKKERIIQPVIGGGMREVEQFLPDGRSYKINGNTAPYAQPLLDANGDSIMLEQSFALTPDIPKDFWEQWLEHNKDSAMVKHGLIFATVKPLELRAMAKANRDRSHGLEPIDTHPESGDPRNPPRAQRLKAGQISAVVKADVAVTG